MTLADLSVPQINRLISHSHVLKQVSLPWLAPQNQSKKQRALRMPSQSLFNKSIAMLFSKRSTRTRLSAETATGLLGGRALFLSRDDIQLGVNESLRDSARVIGGMCQGIFARVGEHSEIEVRWSTCLKAFGLFFTNMLQELAKYSPVPVLNALSSLWHPTQVLADILTLHENAHLFDKSVEPPTESLDRFQLTDLPKLRPLTIAYVGDPANVLNDMLVTYPRLGHKMRIASPPAYQCAPEVWERVKELGCDKDIWWGSDPREAVQGADVIITDTWWVLF